MADKLVSPGKTYEVNIQDDGNLVVYRRDGTPVWASGVDPHPLPPPEVPPFQPLPLLTIRGQFFQANDQPFTVIECSDFNLFGRYCHGELDYVEQVWAQRASVGFNMQRTFTLYNIEKIGSLLNPDYTKIPSYLEGAARHGLYVEFVGYTSTEDPNHWPRLVEACQGSTNVLGELVNEGTLPVNQIDMSRYARPTTMLASHGSGGSEGVPPWEPWDYMTYHTNGSSEEQRKIGHNAMEDLANVYGIPALTNETSRYPDVGMWVNADLYQQKQLAYDSAAGAALLCAGACFHSVRGKTSALWDGTELTVAQTWVAGALSVPKCQYEGYRRRDDLLTDDLLRVYQRGTADANIVRIHK
jgi:hypothetical protein